MKQKIQKLDKSGMENRKHEIYITAFGDLWSPIALYNIFGKFEYYLSDKSITNNTSYWFTLDS